MRRSVLKFFSLVCLASVVLFFTLALSAYLFMQWQAKTFAQHLTEKLAPVVGLTYEGVRLDLSQRALLFKKPNVSFTSTGESVPLEALRVAVPNVYDLVFSGYRLSQGEWPRGVLVFYEGFAPDMEGAFAHAGYRYIEQLHHRGLWPHKSCGRTVDAALLRGLAYNKISLSGNALVILDDADKVIDVSLVARANGIFDFNLQSLMDWTPAASLASSPVRDLQLMIRDAGFNSRYHAYCAQRNQHTESFYRTLLSDEMRSLSEGVGFNEQGYRVWRKMFEDGASLKLRLPIKDLPVGVVFEAYSRQIAQDSWWQGVALEMTEETVRWGEVINPNREQAAVVNALPEQAPTVVEDKTAPEASSDNTLVVNKPQGSMPAPSRPQYRDHDVKDIEKYVGYRARFGTYYGRNIEGKVLAVTSAEVQIEQRMAKGSAVYRLPIEKISYLEVYY